MASRHMNITSPLIIALLTARCLSSGGERATSRCDMASFHLKIASPLILVLLTAKWLSSGEERATSRCVHRWGVLSFLGRGGTDTISSNRFLHRLVRLGRVRTLFQCVGRHVCLGGRTLSCAGFAHPACSRVVLVLLSSCLFDVCTVFASLCAFEFSLCRVVALSLCRFVGLSLCYHVVSRRAVSCRVVPCRVVS